MIGIIGAMNEEVMAIKVLMDNPEEISLYNHTFFKGKISNKNVILCKSGVGKVNAAISTTLMLANFDVDFVINIGTAGGFDEKQNTLDIVISKDLIQHDFDTSYLDGEEGIGIVSKSDDDLRKKVIQAFNEGENTAKIHVGDIISGDIFIGEEEKITKLKDAFPTAIACDMESGAIAAVCENFQIPFIVIRSLSDIVYHDNSNIDFYNNVLETSERSADMVLSFIKMM